MRTSRVWITQTLMVIAISAAALSCYGGDEDGSSGNPEDELNDSLNGSYTLDDPPTDNSITVGSNASGYAEARGGDSLNVVLTFDAPNGNVVGGGIRFGPSGPIVVVSIPAAEGQASGTLNFSIQIPSSICNNLSSICHDIKCYEFAVTDIGAVSRANINDVALACGACDEPSCQSLLTSCEVVDCGVGGFCCMTAGSPGSEHCDDAPCEEFGEVPCGS